MATEAGPATGKMNPEIIAKAEKYLKEKYSDFGPTLAAEKLAENHNIKINKESTRQIMARIDLWKFKPRKSGKKHYVWRVRKDNPGELEQFDGSYHKWFGEEESCLLLAVDDEDWMTQFEKAMSQVGIKPITARSPQAKGRVERMFATLQDRLVKELRLAGITDIDEANKFLEKYIPKFNAKFAVVPARTKDLHKRHSKKFKINYRRYFPFKIRGW